MHWCGCEAKLCGHAGSAADLGRLGLHPFSGHYPQVCSVFVLQDGHDEAQAVMTCIFYNVQGPESKQSLL